MKHQKLTFEDIAQKNILYFDEEVIEACHNICDALKIDNLPGYDSTHYYELKDRQFEKKSINPYVKLSYQQGIFEDSLIEKFGQNKHNVLFVFKGEVLNGIVHFSDYNRTNVLQAIQDDVLFFERRLRQYLFLKNYRNQNMLDYFKYRADKYPQSREFYTARIHSLEKRKNEMNQLGEFQIFDLKDLLEFGNSSKFGKLFPSRSLTVNNENINEINLINSLRNIAMHGKNPVEKNQESSVYSLESLKYLFTALKTLKSFTYKIEKLIMDQDDYKKSVKMDNKSKLEIIHQHHPKALNYFIGY
jgi:hypothetical protein